jgi:uncharacterized protein Yka (UPF0111/DUF47 family)
MPVPREDLLELLLVQDKIANRTRDVSGIVLGRRMQIPESIADQFLDFVDRNVDVIEELDSIETDTDNKQAELRAALYEIEDTLKPVDAVFMYQVIELTGEIADMAERVGRRLELLLSH